MKEIHEKFTNTYSNKKKTIFEADFCFQLFFKIKINIYQVQTHQVCFDRWFDKREAVPFFW